MGSVNEELREPGHPLLSEAVCQKDWRKYHSFEIFAEKGVVKLLKK